MSVVDFPLSEAMNQSCGFEIIAIERHYGMRFDQLGFGATLSGYVWAFENRNAVTSWSTVEHRTVAELQTYFAPEPDDTDPDEPDSELGKGSTPSDSLTSGGPSGSEESQP